MLDRDNNVQSYEGGVRKVWVNDTLVMEVQMELVWGKGYVKEMSRKVFVPELEARASELLAYWLTNDARCHTHPNDGRYCHVCECLTYTE